MQYRSTLLDRWFYLFRSELSICLQKYVDYIKFGFGRHYERYLIINNPEKFRQTRH